MTDFLFDSEEVTWGRDGKKSLSVRGLSTSDITIAIKTHKDSLEKLFSMAEQKFEDETSMAEMGMSLLDQFPDLLADLIALAADRPGDSEQIKKLPAPVQLKLAEAVYQLTIVDTGGLNDFLHQVFALMSQVRTAADSMNSKQAVEESTGT